jgi:hypothetical protein
VSSTDVDGDGLPEIMGTDMGELICFDGDGQRLWERSVGDKVTRIVPVDLPGNRTSEIVVGESPHLFGSRPTARRCGAMALADGVGDVCSPTEGGVAGCGSRSARAIIDGQASWSVGPRPMDGRSGSRSERPLATTSRGAVEAVRLP